MMTPMWDGLSVMIAALALVVSVTSSLLDARRRKEDRQRALVERAEERQRIEAEQAAQRKQQQAIARAIVRLKATAARDDFARELRDWVLAVRSSILEPASRVPIANGYKRLLSHAYRVDRTYRSQGPTAAQLLNIADSIRRDISRMDISRMAPETFIHESADRIERFMRRVDAWVAGPIDDADLPIDEILAAHR